MGLALSFPDSHFLSWKTKKNEPANDMRMKGGGQEDEEEGVS